MKESRQRKQTEPRFAQIENRVLDLLAQDILTKTERRLFWYLFKLERFGDRFVKLPSQGKIAEHLGVRRETINLAQSKLQKLGLFDFQVDGWKARNLVAPKSNIVLEKSLRVLEKNNTELDFDRSELDSSNSGIYIDRACEQNYSDLDQTHTDNAPPEPGAPPTQDLCVFGQSAIDCHGLAKEENLSNTPSPSLPEKPEAEARINSSHEGKDSVAPRDNKSLKLLEQHLPRNIDGSECFPWETTKRGVFLDGFEAHMRRSLCDFPAYKGLMDGELLTKIRKHISLGKHNLQRKDELFIEWDAYQASLASQPTPITLLEIATEPPVPQPTVRVSTEHAQAFKQKLLEKKANVRY